MNTLRIVGLAVFGAALFSGQTPNITGVWKADLEKSKRMGPPITNYLVIIEQKMAIFDRRTKEEAPLVTETTGIWNERGEQRSVFSFFIANKLNVRPYQGVPTRLTVNASADKLVVSGDTAGRPSTLKRTYELSSDGQTLTLDEQVSDVARQMHTTMVLRKQGDEAGEPLRKPEEIAEKHFKNVKTAALKSMPVSDFFDTMHYISWSLGKECTFCHVEHKFDVDDKKEKKTARKMLDMTAGIDTEHFEGHPAVRCFTCHEGRPHPLTYPLFADEIQAEKERAEKEAAEKAAHQGAPPGQGPPPGPPSGPAPQH